MKVNLHKHECRGRDCRSTANVLASDGFCAYFLCVPCTRRGITRQHIKRYRAKLIPIAQAACNDEREGGGTQQACVWDGSTASPC